MASKRESVAGCIRRLRSKLKAAGNGMVTIGHADLMVSLDAVETAHKREVEKLIEIIHSECRKCGECAKLGKDCAAGDVDGAEDDRACKKFVNKEVAELRKCLKEACRYRCGKCNVGNLETESHFCGNCCDTIRRWRKALEGANDAD